MGEQKIPYFEYPTQVYFFNGEDGYDLGIAVESNILCCCCGATIAIEDVLICAEDLGFEEPAIVAAPAGRWVPLRFAEEFADEDLY